MHSSSCGWQKGTSQGEVTLSSGEITQSTVKLYLVGGINQAGSKLKIYRNFLEGIYLMTFMDLVMPNQ